MKLLIAEDGDLSFIYQDDLAPLLRDGTATIRRASHVEPDDNGQWFADLSPVNGPKLGPFPLRQEALDAEVEWLEEHYLI